MRVQQQQERQQRQEEQKARHRRIDNRVDFMMDIVFDFRKWLKEERLTRRKQLKKESAKRVQQLGRMQEQMEKLELSLGREAALRKKGDRDNGERFVWLAERVSQVAHGPDSWTDSQNLVANVERGCVQLGRDDQLGSTRDSDSADASDSSSDWEWKALVQGLPREQRCSSCNGYHALKDFRGLKHGGVKLFKTCNGCREQKRRSGRHKLVFKSR